LILTATLPTAGVLDELLDVAKALGLMRSDGSLDASWFEAPLEHIGRVFGDEGQRQALLDLLDAILPPVQEVTEPGQRWYPLLRPAGPGDHQGNVYLTIEAIPGETLVGLAGSLKGATSGANPVTGSLSLRVPLMRATPSSVEVTAGTSAYPVFFEARADVNLSTAAGDPIGLAAVRVSIHLTAAGAASTRIVLEQLDLNDGTAIRPEAVLDPAELGPEAVAVVLALIRSRMHQVAVDAGLPSNVRLLAQQLPALLGVDPAVPTVPAVPLFDGATALRAWVAATTTGGAAAPIITWLDHLGDLLGVAAAPTGDGTDSAPWTFTVPLSIGAELEIWCVRGTTGAGGTPVFRVGVSIVGGTGASAAVEGRATLFEAALSGTGPTGVLPNVEVRVRAPENLATYLVGPNPTDPVRVRSLVAGFRWDGDAVVPVLELFDVDFEGVHHRRVDLHDGQSVVASGLAVLQGQIAAALGGSTRAQALAALVGLQDPPGTASWPSSSRADFGAFAANPLPEIARVHRAVLGNAVHPWSSMLAALATAVGVPAVTPATVAGAGSAADPWRVPLVSSGALSLELAAWRKSGAGGYEELRIGLRLGGDQSGWHAGVALELLSFDLPAAGPATVRLLGGFHLLLRVSPLPAAFEAAGVAIEADAIRLGLDWAAGGPMTGGASIDNLRVTADGSTLTVADLTFPPGPPTADNPLAGFAVSTAEAQELARLLLARGAIAWGGMPGHTLAGLFGLHRNLAGVASAAPLLTDGGATPFTHPLAALREFMLSVLTGVDAEGVPVAASWLTWLAALIGDALPSRLGRLPSVAITGAGTPEDPWALPIGRGPEPDHDAEVLLWLEPGPPGPWATAAAEALRNATDADRLVDGLARLAPSDARVAEVLAGRSRAGLVDAIDRLTNYLAGSDGVVPVESQVPTGGGWTAGTQANVAHHRAPSDPGVVAQVIAQLGTWPHGAVLLIGPSFTDATQWSALLGAAGAGAPGHVDFRILGIEPAGVDLTSLPVTGWYTADLRDDGGTDPAPLVAQIARLVEHIRSLHGGRPVVVVAHSTAAVAARAFAATAGPSRVAGLIAIAAPLLGAPLTPVVDPSVADALRAVRALFPTGLGDVELDAALSHLIAAVEGFRPAGATAAPAVASPYPVGSFAGSSDVGLGGVPGLAISSRLTGDLVALLRSGLVAAAAGAAGAAPAPTHVGIGWRSAVGVAGSGGDSVAADAHLRVDIGRIRLGPPALAPEPARPATRVAVRVTLSRPGGWLAGAPTSFGGLGAAPLDVRARRIELAMTLEPDGAGGMQLQPSARVVDGAVRGVPVAGGLGTPGLADALGASFRGASNPTPVTGGKLATVLGALEALGLAVPDGHGGIGLSTGALNALAVDAASFLAPRLRAALASPSGILGLVGPTNGPWVAEMPGGLRLSVAADPWSATISTDDDAEAASALTVGGASVHLNAGVTLPGFLPHADLAVRAGRVTVWFSHPEGRLRVEAPPWTGGIDLLPTTGGALLREARDSLLPRLVLSSAVSAVIERLIGPGYLIGPIDALLAEPGRWLSTPTALGRSGSDSSSGSSGPLDPARLNLLLERVAAAAGLPPGPGLTLPGGISVTIGGTDTVRISIAKPAGVALLPDVDLALTLDIDGERHVTPGGTMSMNVPLAGVATGATAPWPSVDVDVGVSSAGVTLTVTPEGGSAIEFLPHFGGFGTLAAGAAALLPSLLDEVLVRTPASPFRTAALRVAQDLDLYDAGGGFAAHQAQLAALVAPGGLAAVTPTAAVGSMVALLNLLGLPGQVGRDGDAVVWGSPTLANRDVEVRGGWGADGPEVRVRTDETATPGGVARLSFTAAFAAGAPTFEAAAALDAPAGLGFPFRPAVRARLAGGRLEVALLPLGVTDESTLAIALAPVTAVLPNAEALALLAERWLVPLASELAVQAAEPLLTRQLWSGGPTLGELLQSGSILATGGPPFHLQSPLPAIATIPGELLRALVRAGTVDIPVGGGLQLNVAEFGSRLGIRLSGALEVDTGSLLARILLGGELTWNGGVDKGLTLYLFDVGGGDVGTGVLTFHPGVHIVGVGLGLSSREGRALIDTADLKVGAIDAFFFADLDSTAGGTPSVTNVGAGVELEGAGLPLGLLGGASQGAGNPVAASLLGNAPGAGGDNRAVNPAVNASVYYRSGVLGVDLDGGRGPVWIGVRRSFGPLYVDQVGVDLRDGAGGPFLGVLVDGAVHVGPLLAQVDDLGVTIPIPRIHQPDRWTLDLRGLAVAFNQAPVSIAGALVKAPGPPVEYDGMLHVQITNLGVSAVGAYARPSDAAGGFTSLFVFAALSYPLGGPPFLFITGLGTGFGYNRELHPPQEIAQIPGFFLVAAIDDNRLANDPMGALAQIGPRVAPKRGALWLAAGLRFTSFVVVQTTAVAYVTLDRGFELGVLGVSRMMLPDADAPVVGVELALKARFSSEEALLSVQAQLTDNSWLFTRDCQLTGGFAFFMWFRESQFVLTLGGYNPAFQRPDRFPVVPRLGFRWRVDDHLLVKGEAYFALTNSCVMLGGRLEAAFEAGPVRAWFIAYADVLISWDPFYYLADIGVSIGVEFTARICFIGCVQVHVSASLGASLSLAGPPLHGSVTIEYSVLSLTIPFGSEPETRDYLTWTQFRDKYLTSGDPSGAATKAQVTAGLLPPDPPGATAAAGTRPEPWKVGAEYVFAVETRLAAERWIDFRSADEHSHADVGDLDLAPMGSGQVITVARLALTRADGTAATIQADRWQVAPVVTPVPEATWRFNDAVPAAARNVKAITGLTVVGVAEPRGRSARIPIATLVDDILAEARPLPFAASSTAPFVTRLRRAGEAADAVVAISADADSATVATLAESLLESGPSVPAVMTKARAASGLPPDPVPALAVASIRHRSAPPLIASLASGLTMQPVARPEPTDIVERPGAELVVLDQPRLRAVFRSQPAAVPVVPHSTPTRVSRVASARGVARVAPPTMPTVIGGRLYRVPDPRSPRPTDAAVAPRTLRSSELGMSASAAEQSGLDAAAEALLGQGTVVVAGSTQVWDLPGALAGAVVAVIGEPSDMTARITTLSRTGVVLADSIGIADRRMTVTLPDRAATLVISSTGRGATGAANGEPTGWIGSSRLAQVGSATLLCREGWLRVSAPTKGRHRGQRATAGLIRAAEAVAGRGVETGLPARTNVVGVLLDLADQVAADNGDLVIAVSGATVAAPVQVDAPRHRLLLYDVTGIDGDAAWLTVAVVSSSGWRVAGTVGLRGRAAEWATRLSEGIPEDLVPDRPSGPDGSVTVRLAPPGSTNQESDGEGEEDE